MSLPFADHCEPLLDDSGKFPEFMNWLRTECDRQRWKFVELRPLLQIQAPPNDLQPSHSYCFHALDIKPSLEQFLAVCTKIRFGERSGELRANDFHMKLAAQKN